MADFLLAAGLGARFSAYCGQLDSKLHDIAKTVRTSSVSGVQSVDRLKKHLEGLVDQSGRFQQEKLQKARLAVLIAIGRHRADVTKVIAETAVNEVEGMVTQIVAALKEKNISLLSSGALEHYLPSYVGNEYVLDDGAKRAAIENELAWLCQQDKPDLVCRYGDLYRVIQFLPSIVEVNFDKILMHYLSRYVHEVQNLIISNKATDISTVNAQMATAFPGWDRLFTLRTLTVTNAHLFVGDIVVAGLVGNRPRIVDFSSKTNAGMHDFTFRSEQLPKELTGSES